MYKHRRFTKPTPIEITTVEGEILRGWIKVSHSHWTNPATHPGLDPNNAVDTLYLSVQIQTAGVTWTRPICEIDANEPHPAQTRLLWSDEPDLKETRFTLSYDERLKIHNEAVQFARNLITAQVVPATTKIAGV